MTAKERETIEENFRKLIQEDHTGPFVISGPKFRFKTDEEGCIKAVIAILEALEKIEDEEDGPDERFDFNKFD